MHGEVLRMSVGDAFRTSVGDVPWRYINSIVTSTVEINLYRCYKTFSHFLRDNRGDKICL